MVDTHLISPSASPPEEIGGVLGGVTRDIYSEGLQLPFVKIFNRAVQDVKLTAIVRANVRARTGLSGARAGRQPRRSGGGWNVRLNR